MDRNLAVIKLGGHSMDDPALLLAFCQNIKTLAESGLKLVLVHGGGPHISSLLKRLHIESHFVDGLRVTDAATLEVAELALCGMVNKSLTRELLKNHVRACGISGEDASLLVASIRKPELGRVGEIEHVNPEILTCLLSGGFLPVVAPLALNRDFEPLNVNADTAAGAIAGAIQARYFILVSDVPGVLDQDKKLLASLNPEEIALLRKNGTISGGMIPKVACCLSAIDAGCREAIILDGTKANTLKDYFENGKLYGTLIRGNTE